MSSAQTTNASVFVGYGEADKEWLDRLTERLAPSVPESSFHVWDSSQIHPGDDWKQGISTALESSRLVILLIGADFLAYDLINERAFLPLLAAAKAKGIRILPVVLSASRFARDLSRAGFEVVDSIGRPLKNISAQQQNDILDALGHIIKRTVWLHDGTLFGNVLSNNDILCVGAIVRVESAYMSTREGGRHVCFTASHPKETKPGIWYTLFAYVHTRDMQAVVETDAKQRSEATYGRQTAKATHNIRRGAEIIVSPELPGCRFNPKSARLLWLEDWHRIEFRLQAQPDLAGCELGKAVNGRIAFYVESVLVGEVPIWTCISDEADTTTADTPASTASAAAYEAIFVSYAHEDSDVVDRLSRAYKVLGMRFLRDVETLRSGEEWNRVLASMIENADIFQLYWSHAAKRSRYVGAEWRHALKQEKRQFIRPVYWQLPMPRPPRALANLHFSCLKLDT